MTSPYLSVKGNLDEFGIPDTELGRRVCGFRLAWGVVDKRVQPCIICAGLTYPNFRFASREEVNHVLGM